MTCYRCGNTGHYGRDCDISFDAYYKRTGKPDKEKIYLDVKYRDKNFAKAHGARWHPEKKKWYVFDRVPDALKQFEPARTYTYIKPEKTIDGLCKYCFFSFEEGLKRSQSDASACVHCAPKKQPPTCKHCRKFMVSDSWPANDMEDNSSCVVIHDIVGNPMMYGGGCSLQQYGGCRNRPGHWESFVNDCRSSGLFPPFSTENFCEDIESMRTTGEKDKMYNEGDAILSKLHAQLPNDIQVREQTHNKLVLDINNTSGELSLGDYAKHVHKVVCETLQTNKGFTYMDKWCVDQENSPGSRYVLTPMKCLFGER